MTRRPLPCEEARALLDERLDRDLDGAEADALDAHLAACAACAAEAAALAAVDGALRGMDGPDPGPAFSDRVVAALDRAPGGPAAAPVPGSVRLLRGLVAAAGTGAFAALAVALLPLDAAAATVGGLVPAIPTPSLPAIPAGLGGALPAWAAVLGAVLAAAAAVPVAALRRPARRP